MDVLDKAKSPQYAFEGEQGMWSAGAFQGTGMGFGVWCRDTMQMLLRGIGFIEPGITRRTVEYILKIRKRQCSGWPGSSSYFCLGVLSGFT